MRAHDQADDLPADDRPFPPPVVTRVYAYALSLVFVALLFSLWGGENPSEELQDDRGLSTLL